MFTHKFMLIDDLAPPVNWDH